MKEYNIDFTTADGEKIAVRVINKKVKNYSIKIKNCRAVIFTCGATLNIKRILEILKTKEKWIVNHLKRIDSAVENLSIAPLINMIKIRILGKQKVVETICSDRNNVVYDGEIIKLYTTDTTASEKNIKLLEKWYTNYAYKVFTDKINKFMPIMAEQYKVAVPSLVVRRMKGVWGNCRPQVGRLTINEYLLMASEENIESVILHELAHLVVAEHNKRFYDVITKIMPDYKDRQKELNSYLL